MTTYWQADYPDGKPYHRTKRPGDSCPYYDEYYFDTNGKEYHLNHTSDTDWACGHMDDTPEFSEVMDKVKLIQTNFMYLNRKKGKPVYREVKVAENDTEFVEWTKEDSKSPKNCGICFQEIISVNKGVKLLCNHYFHKSCLGEVFFPKVNDAKCPTCKLHIYIPSF